MSRGRAQPAKRGHGQEAAAPSLAARDAPAGVASALLHRFHPERQHEDNDLDGVMGALKAAGPGRGQGRPGPQPCPPGVSCQKPPFPEACPLLMGTHLAPVREKEAEARTPAPQRGGCELRDEQLSRVRGEREEPGPARKAPRAPAALSRFLFSLFSHHHRYYCCYSYHCCFLPRLRIGGCVARGCDLEMSTFAQSWGSAPWNSPPLDRAVRGDCIPEWGGAEGRP